MLVQKGQYIKMYLFTSSFIYIYVKIRYVYQDLHTRNTRFQYTYQDLRTRIEDPLVSTSSLININQLPLTQTDNSISRFVYRHQDAHLCIKILTRTESIAL